MKYDRKEGMRYSRNKGKEEEGAGVRYEMNCSPL
jgi:hypothetical protein